eukprot:CAMPEP_0119208406 /NCGR_PEP_ID=MMETSP1327-20130426/620_1 /TAXON_ID=38833 /ORGANISM="Micromonas pusilla, Strain RCC2306" /LENGTH=365 /DNA_ID=CAMNT_0007204923 /DNA_START=21 /DNA_END=1118 /DNA_ORIENTATION=-
MATVCTPLALGAKLSVRGTKVVNKRVPAPKPMRFVAKAQISKVNKAAAVAAVTTLVVTPSANASELGEELFSVFDSIDKAADKVESAINVAAEAVGKGLELAGSAADAAAPVVQRALDAARPVGEAGLRYAERTVGPVASDLVGKASGVASGVVSSAGAAIKSKGIDLEPVSGAAGAIGKFAQDEVTDLTPTITGFADYLQTASPVELVQTAGAAGLVYLLAPALLGVFAGVARGYAGSIRPVEAYDEVLSGGNLVIIDVRGANEVQRGTVEFPRRASSKVISVPREKLSGNFKNMGDVEATLTATKIASLKGVKKNTKVIILDNNGRGDAPKVAKALGGQGFRKVFVLQGGIAGWANAGLGISA